MIPAGRRGIGKNKDGLRSSLLVAEAAEVCVGGAMIAKPTEVFTKGIEAC